MFTARILGACNIFQSEHLQVLWLSLRGADLEEIKRIQEEEEEDEEEEEERNTYENKGHTGKRAEGQRDK